MTIDSLVIWQKNADGSGLVFSPDYYRPVRLNVSGSIIFESLLSGGDTDAAVTALQKHFPSVSVEKLQADVLRFHQDMVDTGILR